MATTLKQHESAPAARPDLAIETTVSAEAIWQRIESWIAHRWGSREVVWIVEVANGGDEWTPPLTPAEIDSVEHWNGSEWLESLHLDGPLGVIFPGDGTYRVTSTVGAAGDPPGAVVEAWRRLALFVDDTDDKAGASNFNINLGSVEYAYDRSPAWMAKALHHSGAADLLKPYRRA